MSDGPGAPGDLPPRSEEGPGSHVDLSRILMMIDLFQPEQRERV